MNPDKFLAGYIIVAIITFGYSYNVGYTTVKQPSLTNEAELNSVTSMMAGLLWPLYWTVQVFKPLRAQQ